MKCNQNAAIPEEVLRLSLGLGERIRTARIRRKLRQEDLASRTGLSRSTIQNIERGDINCSLSVFLQVLWNLGLSSEFELIADPGLDRGGLSLALSADKKRVFIPTRVDNDF